MDTQCVLPVEDRIAKLLDEMPAQRRMLLKLVDYCREAKTSEEFDIKTSELNEYNFCVYSALELRVLLEQAGAIVNIAQVDNETATLDVTSVNSSTDAEVGTSTNANVNTTSIADSYDNEDVAVLKMDDEEARISYLTVPEVIPAVWLASDEGLALVDAQDDEKEIHALLDKEPRYVSVYERMLDFLGEEGGHTIKELDAAFNDLEVLQHPRRLSGYFVGRLERGGAIEWRGTWRLTPVGRVVLETLRAAKRMTQASA